MNCTKASSLLSLHLDGALEVSQSRAVHDHLQSCVSCRSELSSLKQTKNLLSVAGRKTAPADLLKSVF